tara:strand:+ start:633 stop:1418 length:786 start_codon:yes stop_codon:yes gene_type:complete
MKIIENINTAEQTMIVFHGGNLKERNDVSFFEDLDLLTKELFKIKILQNPITNINVELIYDAEMHDPGEAMREELKIEPFDEDLEHQMDLMLEGGTLNDVAMHFDVDLAAVRYNLKQLYYGPCNLPLISILPKFEKITEHLKNRIEILYDLWIDNGRVLNDMIFSKLHKDFYEVNFTPTTFNMIEMDGNDNSLIRHNYNNPRWEGDDNMAYMQDDDIPHLKNLREAIESKPGGNKFKLILIMPNGEETDLLDDFNIDWVAE